MTTLLKTNPFVTVIALDFSKAFDTVRHSELMSKFAKLDMPDVIHNWLVNFFTGRSHCTKYAGATSATAPISASVVQGSAIGPASYAVTAADLHPITDGNSLAKFADDTYLIVPASLSSTIANELANIDDWATCNNLKLNKTKSYELIFRIRRDNKSAGSIPPLTQGISRVSVLKCLGVTISDNVSVTPHINDVLGSCASSLYALRMLRAKGLCNELLQIVFKSTVLSKLLYASQVWWGYANAADKDRLQSFLRKATKAKFCTEEISFETLCKAADHALFKKVTGDPSHVLYALLPPKVSHTYNLRPKGHHYELSVKTSNFDDKNFITRMLFEVV